MIVERDSSVRSRGEVVRHAIGVDADDVVLIDGMLVTSVARTVLDLAAEATFMSAVTAADFALCHKREARIGKPALDEMWENRLPFRGHVRARRVLDFSTDLAESPLESGSRVNMHLLGFPAPELQVEWRDYRGLIGYSDFYWRAFNRVGEADGRAKYFDDTLTRGRSLKQILFDEKIREDRVRALGPGFSRWDWDIGMNPRRLKPFLLAAGLPLGDAVTVPEYLHSGSGRERKWRCSGTKARPGGSAWRVTVLQVSSAARRYSGRRLAVSGGPPRP